MYVHQLLEERGQSEVRCIKVGQTLLEAADVLSKYDIGSLLVLDDRDVFIGIMTERDLVYATTHFGLDTGNRLVRDIMTTSVVTCRLDDDVVATLNLMNSMNFRHMPVIADGKPVAVLSIREFDYACKRLQLQANTDELTGLPNRRQFMELLEAEFSRHDRHSDPFCVAMVDIDDFKLINDTYGHHCGDQVLISLAALFKADLRAYDTVARLGGEEFGILFPKTNPQEAVKACKHVADRIRAVTVRNDKGIVTFTASFGIASVGPKAEDSESILKFADDLLYLAKASGKDRIAISQRQQRSKHDNTQMPDRVAFN